MLCSSAQQAAVLHLRGQVTDAANRNPIPGVTVSAVEARHSATTDANGFFSVELRDGVKPGDDIVIRLRKRVFESIALPKPLLKA